MIFVDELTVQQGVDDLTIDELTVDELTLDELTWYRHNNNDRDDDKRQNYRFGDK